MEKDQWVITKDNISIHLYIKDPNNWEYITLVKYIGDGEDDLSNIQILSEKQHLEKYFKKNDLEVNMYFAVSNSDYFNYEIRVQ